MSSCENSSNYEESSEREQYFIPKTLNHKEEHENQCTDIDVSNFMPKVINKINENIDPKDERNIMEMQCDQDYRKVFDQNDQSYNEIVYFKSDDQLFHFVIDLDHVDSEEQLNKVYQFLVTYGGSVFKNHHITKNQKKGYLSTHMYFYDAYFSLEQCHQLTWLLFERFEGDLIDTCMYNRKLNSTQLFRLPCQLKFGVENTQHIPFENYVYGEENTPSPGLIDKNIGSQFFIQTYQDQKNNFPDMSYIIKQPKQYTELYRIAQIQDEDGLQIDLEEYIIKNILESSHFGKTFLIERFVQQTCKFLSDFHKQGIREVSKPIVKKDKSRNKITYERIFQIIDDCYEKKQMSCDEKMICFRSLIRYSNKQQQIKDKYLEKKPEYDQLLQQIQLSNEEKFAELLQQEHRINISTKFTFSNIMNKKYITEYELLVDMQKCMCQIIDGNVFILKALNKVNKLPHISYNRKGDFQQTIQEIIPNMKEPKFNRQGRQLNLWDYFTQHQQIFKYETDAFYSTDKKVFSYFSGFSYEQQQGEEKIQLFIKHSKNVICNGNEELYTYLMNWIAYVFQNPGKLTKVNVVMTSPEGTGKNIFTNAICQLVAQYSNKNVNSEELISGRFNGMLENKMITVKNEVSDVREQRMVNTDKMKSLTTEDTFEVENKNEKSRTVQNCNNFFILSNHPSPAYFGKDDRRHFVLEVSDEFAKLKRKTGNTEYFDNLIKETEQEGFYEQLLNFFMERDLSEYNTTKIPMTQIKKNMTKLNQTQIESFVEEYKQQFTYGVLETGIYQVYKQYCEENGYKNISSSKYFKNDLNKLCKQIKTNTYMTFEGKTITQTKTDKKQNGYKLISDE